MKTDTLKRFPFTTNGDLNVGRCLSQRISMEFIGLWNKRSTQRRRPSALPKALAKGDFSSNSKSRVVGSIDARVPSINTP